MSKSIYRARLGFGVGALLAIAAGAFAGCGGDDTGAAGSGGAGGATSATTATSSGTAGGAESCEPDPNNECQVCAAAACMDNVAECCATPGCTDIVACARMKGCGGVDCYKPETCQDV